MGYNIEILISICSFLLDMNTLLKGGLDLDWAWGFLSIAWTHFRFLGIPALLKFDTLDQICSS